MSNPGPTAARLPPFNKLLFSADHIGLQAVSYFRQQWALFFLAPPALDYPGIGAPATAHTALALPLRRPNRAASTHSGRHSPVA